jgi:hypothetical protein
MGYDDPEDDSFNVKLIPKPGARPVEGGQAMNPNAANVRPVLADAARDNKIAQSAWEQALKNNIGQPVQDAAQAIGRKFESLFGGTPGADKPLPRQMDTARPTNEDAMDALRNQMLQERAQSNGNLSPEQIARFQRLKESILKGSVTQPQPPIQPVAMPAADTDDLKY